MNMVGDWISDMQPGLYGQCELCITVAVAMTSGVQHWGLTVVHATEEKPEYSSGRK